MTFDVRIDNNAVYLNGEVTETLRHEWRYTGRCGDYVLKVDHPRFPGYGAWPLRAPKEFYTQTATEIRFLSNNVKPEHKDNFPELIAHGEVKDLDGNLIPWLVTRFVELDYICPSESINREASILIEEYGICDTGSDTNSEGRFGAGSPMINCGVRRDLGKPFFYDVGINEKLYAASSAFALSDF